MATALLGCFALQFHTVHQQLASNPLADIPAAVRKQLDGLAVDPPQGEVAITAGSRGIANIALILHTCGEWLRERGAEPFVVPAMGSHNGATADGQQAMLEGLGMTEAALGMTIRSSMDTVTLANVHNGPVTMDRFAHEAAGVLVVNRVKPHTSFGGPPYGEHCESGLAKMMTVGLGKVEAARTFHAAPFAEKPGVLRSMAEVVAASDKVWAGLAILEDGYDQTAELHAIPANEIIDREPSLLARHAERYFPKLPVDELNVLVVEQIGKNFSGTGLDTNVIGRRGIADAPALPSPRIESIAALSLSPESQGNAVGVGLCDAITQRLYDAIDFDKTRLNAQTTGDLSKAEPPLVLPDDAAVFEWLRQRHGEERWVVIPNTLELATLRVSEDLADEFNQSG
ncbi:MAG: DUF2088 domain-containing protein [Planctomycetota bacterium]